MMMLPVENVLKPSSTFQNRALSLRPKCCEGLCTRSTALPDAAGKLVCGDILSKGLLRYRTGYKSSCMVRSALQDRVASEHYAVDPATYVRRSSPKARYEKGDKRVVKTFHGYAEYRESKSNSM